MKINLKWIIGFAATLTAIGTIYAFADDVLYFQSEANIHLTQDSARICKEDRAELIDLRRYIESLDPPIPRYLFDQLALLEESVAQHCTKRT